MYSEDGNFLRNFTGSFATHQNLKIERQISTKLLFTKLLGDSANAVPHYHKLCTRVTHIWGNRRGQPNRSAMEGPRPGGSASLITDSPVPGKYASHFRSVRLYDKTYR